MSSGPYSDPGKWQPSQQYLAEPTVWLCSRDSALTCPPEGCPKSYGCARDHGWKPGDPTPRECLGLKPNILLEKQRDEANAYGDAEHARVVLLEELLAKICSEFAQQHPLIARGRELLAKAAPSFPSRFDYRYDHTTGRNERL